MKSLIAALSLAIVPAVASADGYFGVEGGLGFADIGAKETAQQIANLAGSTVTVTYDRATYAGRLFVGAEVTKAIRIEAGYFSTGNLTAKYVLSGASAKESYTASGFDIAAIMKPENQPFYFKAGVHSSKVSGNGSITIGGSTYSADAKASGTGMLLGAGYEETIDATTSWTLGLTYYNRVAGESRSATLASAGIMKKF